MSTPTQDYQRHAERIVLSNRAADVISRRGADTLTMQYVLLCARSGVDIQAWTFCGPILEEFGISLETQPGFWRTTVWRATCHGVFGEAHDPCEAVLRALINWDAQAPL